jgi:hypothetical protein
MIQLFKKENTAYWALTKNGQFSVASLYKHCAFPGVVDVRMTEMWGAKIPLKVRHFLWPDF